MPSLSLLLLTASSERDLKAHLLGNGKQAPSTMSTPTSNGQLRYTANNNLNNGTNNHSKPANGKVAQAADKEEEERSARQSLIILAAIFFTSLFAMIYVYAMFPRLEE